jgi:hypothetical protein
MWKARVPSSSAHFSCLNIHLQIPTFLLFYTKKTYRVVRRKAVEIVVTWMKQVSTELNVRFSCLYSDEFSINRWLLMIAYCSNYASCFVWMWNLVSHMMEAARTSGTSVDIQLRKRQYIPEDSELGTYMCSSTEALTFRWDNSDWQAMAVSSWEEFDLALFRGVGTTGQQACGGCPASPTSGPVQFQ